MLEGEKMSIPPLLRRPPFVVKSGFDVVMFWMCGLNGIEASGESQVSTRMVSVILLVLSKRLTSSILPARPLMFVKCINIVEYLPYPLGSLMLISYPYRNRYRAIALELSFGVPALATDCPTSPAPELLFFPVGLEMSI